MRIVIALGGNALLRRSDPMTTEVQRRNVAVAAQAALLGLLKRLTDLGLELDHLRLVPLGQAGSPTAG